MAWIKIDHTTPDKPEIVAIASALNIDQDAAFGKCVRIWIWADQQTIDGSDLPVTPSFIDRLTNCPGFADCLVKVGWLKRRSDRLSLPHFDRHNGQTAKNRALTSDRMQRLRDGQSVTQSSPEKEKEGEKEKEVKIVSREGFEEFRQAYPGRKRGLDVELEHFLTKTGKRAAAIFPLLLPAAKAYAERCERESVDLKHRKHLKTWINQQCWTEEDPAPRARPRPVVPVDDYPLDSEWETADG